MLLFLKLLKIKAFGYFYFGNFTDKTVVVWCSLAVEILDGSSFHNFECLKMQFLFFVLSDVSTLGVFFNHDHLLVEILVDCSQSQQSATYKFTPKFLAIQYNTYVQPVMFAYA